LKAVYAEPLAEQAASVRKILRADSVDAILADLTFTGVLPILLNDPVRPPILVCGVSPLTLTSADTPPFGLAWRPLPGFDYRRMNTIAHRVIMRGSQRVFDRAVRRAGGGSAPVFVSDWPRLADGLVQLTVRDFEYPRSDLPPTVEFVGPVLPADIAGFDPPQWWGDVRSADAVVLVTQGTYDNVDLNQLIIPTLEALADQPDLLVVATTGRRPGQALPSSLPPNARVADWLPYSALMPHVDVMVTNGGYGGVQFALSHGVPLVVAGETSDKAEIAARVDYSGVGIDLGTATPSPAAVRAAVGAIRRNGTYRAAAERLRAEIESATPIDTIANALKRCCGA
jgi:hypothetical protein